MKKSLYLVKYIFATFLISAVTFLMTGASYGQACPVDPDFSFEVSCQQLGKVYFTNESSPMPGGMIDGYKWDFGDGNYSSATHPVHTYASTGTYAVVLSVYDTSGCHESITYSVIISDFPTASFNWEPINECARLPVTFYADQSTGNGLTYTWYFGDGTYAVTTAPTIQHQYYAYTASNCGMYNKYEVQLIVSDVNGCEAEANNKISVQSYPKSWPIDLSGNDFVICHPEGSTGDTLWVDTYVQYEHCVPGLDIDWGDGSFSNGLSLNDFPVYHVYASPGNYNFRFITHGQHGCDNDTSILVTYGGYPDATVNMGGTAAGCAPVTASFSLSDFEDNDYTTTYTWDFGDGSSQVIWDYEEPYQNNSISHVYTQSHCENANAPDSGFIVSVIIENLCGSDTVHYRYIEVFNHPEASFTFPSPYGCLDEPFGFTNNTNPGYTDLCDPSNNYEWDFGDGNTSMDSTGWNTYASPGSFDVTLTADNGYCADDTTITVYITGVHAEFSFDTACINSPTHFQDLSYAYDDPDYTPDPSIQLVSYNWDFGDGNTSGDASPEHTYASSGSYQVSLTVISEYGCDSTTIRNVIVNEPEIDTVLIDSVSCNNFLDGGITIQASSIYGIHSYTLNPGDTTNTTGVFTGLGPGTYILTVEDNSYCKTYDTVHLFNPDPLAYTIDSTNVSCNGYHDGSILITATGGTGSLEYSIDGGNTYHTGNSFLGLGPGNYVVTIQDGNGCETQGDTITLSEPDVLEIYGFLTSDPTCFGCSNGQITAQVQGGTPPYDHSWSNGMTGNPVTGLTAGWYTDTVTDVNGCQVIDSIELIQPASFIIHLDSSDVLCYGGNTGWVSATVTGGTEPYAYEWRMIPDATLLGTNDTLWNCTAGYYEFTVTDIYGNVAKDTIEVVQPDPVLLTFMQSDTICYGNSNGWASVTVTGGINPYTYLWSGGTGTTTDSVYNLSPGNYTVTVTDANGCQETGTVSIVENPQLIVTISSLGNSVCYGDSIFLQANPSGGTLPAISYQWTPETDLSSPNSASTWASPLSPVEYHVQVLDSRGCEAGDSIAIAIHDNPVADFSFTNPCGSNAVNFTDESTIDSGNVVFWHWQFGDGYSSYHRNPVHIYQKFDTTYNVTLIAHSDNGCTDTITKSLYINPILNLTASSDTVCYGFSTHFTYTIANPAANIVSWLWDFGDGNTSTEPEPDHIYTAPGVYVAYLTVEDSSGCTEAASTNVRVHALPVPDFSDSTSCYDSLTYFKDLSVPGSSGIVSWDWDFGDGTGSSFQNPVHHYVNHGTYTVTLTITNGNGCVDTYSRDVISFPAPEADFIADTACLGSPTNFTDLSSSASGVINQWYWDFGDGTTSSLQDPLHTYLSSGIFVATLIVTNTAGCSDTVSYDVLVYAPPEASFTHAGSCAGNPVQFTDQSTANAASIISWYWNFDDGHTSTEQNPVHSFAGAGTYDVSLTVQNSNGCSSDTTIPVIIHALPIPDFSDSTSCVNGLTYFTDLSDTTGGTSIGSWLWRFGDGNTSIQQDPGNNSESIKHHQMSRLLRAVN
ncbi:MAG: PKD domain-containing protein [Bacteroidales bacterium]